jgi:hypothetical protein
VRRGRGPLVSTNKKPRSILLRGFSQWSVPE